VDGAPGTVVLGEGPPTVADVVAVARLGARVEVAAGAEQALARSRGLVEEHLAGGRAVYGISTGFGALADARISPEDLGRLQRNLVRSHAAGAGDLLPVEVIRAIMLLRARALAAGYSGVRPEVPRLLVELLNRGLHPAVPSRGSVGASGDLAQLAHVALCLQGEGRMLTEEGGTEPAGETLRRTGLEPLVLEAKEGLALVNGTEGMLAVGVLAHHDTATLLTQADIGGAMTIEAAYGTDRPFAEELMSLRPHPGQAASAENLRRLLAGSEIVASHRESEHAVQDPYSMRCAPQVHGAARDAHAFAGAVLDRELASVVDNPVLLPDGRVESNGNFHGEPLAQAFDLLAIALTGLGGIAERRTAWVLGIGAERGLPPFLSTHAGLGSGYMLAQYTQAALVSECKVLAHPASVDSIPTSGLQEDHVSMGWHGGLQLREVAGMVRTVLAAEALCGAQALDLRDPQPGQGTAAARAAIRERVPFLEEDREVAADLHMVEKLIAGGVVRAEVERAVGALR
jgi:histidine ammonia-lyase